MPMFARQNDPKLLWFAMAAFLVGAVASAVGIAHFTIATSLAAASEWGVANVIIAVGYFGWFFALMYAFAKPGRSHLLRAFGPGLVLAPLVYFAVLRPRYPQVDQSLLIVGLLGGLLGYPAL